jgi:hypothetical protein
LWKGSPKVVSRIALGCIPEKWRLSKRRKKEMSESVRIYCAKRYIGQELR